MSAWQFAAFAATFVVIAIGLGWNVWLFHLARRFERDQQNRTTSDVTEADFTWVFVVPALNEEVTIADSVERLLGVRCTRRHIVVVDDGSTDRTPDILAGIDNPDLFVIRRDLPEAQVGKAAALNHAWRTLPSIVDDLDRSSTIVCIVDADGRLAADAPEHVAQAFERWDVGGVQVRVRIYNRATLLTKAQDVEFGVYGKLYQAARSGLGTAGMGGNGQFNRLVTLDQVAGPDGEPWRDRLTEDQDIGLRMLESGWRCEHDNRVSVDQQGLSNLRRLLRQRTRWAQGNMQAMGHLRRIHDLSCSRGARLDVLWALLQPVAALVVGVGFAVALLSAVFGGVAIVPGEIWWLLIFALFGFGGVVLGCIARTGRGPRAWVVGGALGLVYSAYTWLLWPVLVRALWRQFRAKSSWAKTEREAIAPGPAPSG